MIVIFELALKALALGSGVGIAFAVNPLLPF